jgi:GNAT superfamily N-acetyltransferase
MAGVDLRPMAAADVAPAADMMRRGDWGDRSTFLAWTIGHPSCHPLVAIEGGRVVGTGIATAYGHVGWVGTIFVDAVARGRGLGRALTRAVLDDLERRGCRTQLLIATPYGQPLYEREGFTIHAEQHRFAADGLTADDPAPGVADDPAVRVRAFEPDLLPAILALDRMVSDSDRGAVIRGLANPESLRVAVGADGGVRAFLIRGPWGGAGLVAPDPDDAIRLLDWRRRRAGPAARVATGLPAQNVVGRARMAAEGWVEERGGTRMIRGEPLAWRPDAVWGQINGALG